MSPRLLVLLLFVVPLVSSADEPHRRPPNVILIMADDLGVEGLGCYGGVSYKTPHLDKLAAEGLRFTHAYAQPLCTCTRTELMTGRYNNRNWIGFGLLDPTERTFGHHMSDAGYRTAMAGKWQLHSYDPPDYPGADLRRSTGMLASDAGFHQYSLWHTGHTEDKGSRYAGPTIDQNRLLTTHPIDEYGPDLWVEWINKQLEHFRYGRSGRPFFLYYSMALPHWPMVPTPDSEEWPDPQRRNEEDTKYFPDMVAYMDDCVGRIVAEVDRLGMAENTLILFYSDNGTHRKIRSELKDGTSIQGGKGLTTDAGTHVPLIARWKGVIEPGVTDALVCATDFVPTLLEVAQRKRDIPTDIDGVSFAPVLFGESEGTREWVFCHYDPRPGWDKDQFGHIQFARDRRYKLYSDGRFYDVQNDPLEETPLGSCERSEAAEAARKKLVRNTLRNATASMFQGPSKKITQRGSRIAASQSASVVTCSIFCGPFARAAAKSKCSGGPERFHPQM